MSRQHTVYTPPGLADERVRKTVRLPADLAALLTDEAEQRGMTENDLLVQIIAQWRDRVSR